MFGIGLPELLLILGLGLIVLGPEKMPELARSLAKGLVELKKTAENLKESMQEELREGEKALPAGLKDAGAQQGRDPEGQGAEPSDLLPEEFGTLEANSAPSIEGGTPVRAVEDVVPEATTVDAPAPVVSAPETAAKDEESAPRQ